MREEMLHYAPNDKAINEERQGMRGLAFLGIGIRSELVCCFKYGDYRTDIK